MSAIDKIKAKAKSKVMHIVLPEGTEPRTVQATRKITDQGIAKVTLPVRSVPVSAATFFTSSGLPSRVTFAMP